MANPQCSICSDFIIINSSICSQCYQLYCYDCKSNIDSICCNCKEESDYYRDIEIENQEFENN